MDETRPAQHRVDSGGAQPATPRMLRNASGSVRGSHVDITDDSPHSAAQDFGQLLQQHVQQTKQSAAPGPELLPPANISLPTPQPHSRPRPQAALLPQPPSQQQHAPPPHPPHPHHHDTSGAPTQSQFHRKSIGDWDFIKTIGAGSMGKVKLAQHNATGEVCAVKIVPRAAKLFQRAHANDPAVMSAQAVAQRQKEFEKEVARDKRTIREAALGRLLYHPFICRLYEMVPMTNHYYMLFEYVEGGQMLDYIVLHGLLKEKSARKFVRGIALALDYCHKNNVVHRDLKIENIMINQKGDIKIIDFGLSNLYLPTTLLKTYCGSLYFAAPELLSARPYTGPEVDIWLFGVVLYVLVCGKVPFDDKSVLVLHEKIKRGNVEYPDFVSKECISLLSRMLVVDPLKRATLYEIMHHPWMLRGYDHVPSSYLPKRAPLQLPLDPTIIKHIASFDLGTEQVIAHELTTILSSVEYQMSCENWNKLAKQGREYNSASNAHLLPDPTAGFHPLISIYFLIDEMRKRKKLKEQAMEMQRQLQQQPQPQPQPQPPLPPQQDLEPQPQRLTLLREHPEKVTVAPSPRPSGLRPSGSHQETHPLDTLTPPQPDASRMLAPFDAVTPQAPPALLFPEAAHTSPTTYTLAASYATDNTLSIPEQQPYSPHSAAANVETLDPASKGGFNSILRRLLTKSKNKHLVSPHKTSGEYNYPSNAPPVPSVSISNLHDDQQHVPLLPQQYLQAVDPMVRRGVSMKITAKEKLSGLRVNLVSPKRQLPKKVVESEPQHLKVDTSKPVADETRHTRAASAATTTDNQKFQGFVPVEYLPPLPANKLAPAKDARKMHPTARAKSVGGHLRKELYSQRNPGAATQHPPLPNSLAAQNSDEIIDAYFDDVTLDDYQEVPPALTEEQIIDQFNHAKPGTMPSIEYPKTLFLKGFFSVQTTSTKPLPVIRYNIIRVLTKLGVKLQEVKGGFICSHNASYQDPVVPKTTQEERLYGDAFKLTSSLIEKSVSASAEAGVPPRIRTPDQEKTVARQPSLHFNPQTLSPTDEFRSHRSSNSVSGSGHRRKFSVGQLFLNSYRRKNGSQVAMPPNTPASSKVVRGMYADDADEHELEHDSSRQFADGDSVDSMNGLMIGGGSDMLVSSRVEQKARHQHSSSNASSTAPHATSHASKSPLKFEILVVKVPLVGIYGVQFKKILGNTWNYKTLAGEILNELNL